MRRFPGRFSVVAMIDTDRPDAEAVLEGWVRQGCEGLRLGPLTRSPGRDPLAIWRKAAQLGIPISCLGSLAEFTSPEFEGLFQQFPRLPIIIEHLGGGGTDRSEGWSQYQKVLSLARYPNAYMKIHGFGEFCPRPMPMVHPMPFTNIPPLIEMAVDAFGSNRLMWGSDFPPVANREGYRNALKLPMEYVKFKSQEDREWAFGKTAASLFKFHS
jgi:L-fuconolactonase